MEIPILNHDKSINAILYIAKRIKRKDLHKIFKVLYFADRDHLAKYGRAITNDIYIKMNNGPVPSRIYDIFKIVRGDSIFKDMNNYSELFEFESHYIIKPLKEADLDYLSESDVEELDHAIAKLEPLSFAEITRISHDFAWGTTNMEDIIDVKNMLREVGEEEELISYLCD